MGRPGQKKMRLFLMAAILKKRNYAGVFPKKAIQGFLFG